MNTLAAEEWIQSVLAPRLRKLVATRGELSGESQISAWAARSALVAISPMIAALPQVTEIVLTIFE